MSIAQCERIRFVAWAFTLPPPNQLTCLVFQRQYSGSNHHRTILYYSGTRISHTAWLLLATDTRPIIKITGILGLKAYRCLSRSRFILVVVWVLQLSIWALFALDIRGINSPRRISGTHSFAFFSPPPSPISF